MLESNISHNTIFCDKFRGKLLLFLSKSNINYNTIFSNKFGGILLCQMYLEPYN